MHILADDNVLTRGSTITCPICRSILIKSTSTQRTFSRPYQAAPLTSAPILNHRFVLYRHLQNTIHQNRLPKTRRWNKLMCLVVQLLYLIVPHSSRLPELDFLLHHIRFLRSTRRRMLNVQNSPSCIMPGDYFNQDLSRLLALTADRLLNKGRIRKYAFVLLLYQRFFHIPDLAPFKRPALVPQPYHIYTKRLYAFRIIQSTFVPCLKLLL